jgi:hypothetical protein
MKLRDLFILLVFLLLTPLALSQTYSVALDPTEMFVYLSPVMNKVEIHLRVWNPSETANLYTINISDDLKPYLRWNCSDSWKTSDYWCVGRIYPVPAHTEKFVNDTVIKLLFLKTTSNEFSDQILYFYLYPNPRFNQSGNVVIEPRAEIKLHLSQSNQTTTTTTTTTSATSITQTATVTQTQTQSTTQVSLIPSTTSTTTTSIQNPNTERKITQIDNGTVVKTITNKTIAEENKPSFLDQYWLYIAVAGGVVTSAGVYLFFKWYF